MPEFESLAVKPKLSDLIIDTDKDWMGYLIKNLKSLVLQSLTADPPLVAGEIWFRSDLKQPRITVDGTLAKVILTDIPFLSGWNYRRRITIDNTQNSNTLTDYQVLVTVDTASPISAGKMRSDGGDIRFTDSDGTTLLNYWIQEGINTSSTKIWVKVPSIPASSKKVIYLYYGNPSATSLSNGDNTFDFFDDFLGTSLDTTKWQALSGGSISVSNGELVLTGDGTYRGKIISKTFQTTENNAIVSKGRVADPTNSSALLLIQCNKTFSVAYDKPSNGFFLDLYGTDFPIVKTVNGTLTNLSGTGTDPWPDTAYHIHELRKSGSTLEAWMDGSKKASVSDTTTFVDKYIGLTSRELNYTTYFDWVFVRKYILPEPTTSVGTEQENLYGL
jgi:hypothetical protein